MIFMYRIPTPTRVVEHLAERFVDRFVEPAVEAYQRYKEDRAYCEQFRKPHIRKRTWTPGRAHTGYETFSIAERGFYDCWLIRYPQGSFIPKHKDPLPWFDFFRPSWAGDPKVFRLNVVLKPAKVGGEFRCEKAIVRTKRVALFRPDKVEHEVTPVLQGTRYVFSIGFAL